VIVKDLHEGLRNTRGTDFQRSVRYNDWGSF
jgi:hypothetical protein